MSQMQTSQVRRRSGELDVYTGLLLVATIVLAVGATILFLNNTEHSADNDQQGGAFKVLSDN